jgi:undecaprenyl-diphosphatase
MHSWMLSTGSQLALPLATATPPISEANAQMNIIQAIVLGIVQGLTEFLPISSTAHLKAVPVALGWGDPGVAFTAVIQLGSIVAIVWYFWKDLVQVTTGSMRALIKRDYQSPDFKVGLGILLGTLPILFFGILIKVLIPDFDRSPLRSMTAIACASIVMALLLAIAETVGRRKRSFEKLGTQDGVLMGFGQALALIPGVSRSGSTLTTGLFMGMERAAAARFSFLLGIPAITIAGLVELKGLLESGLGDTGPLPIIAGVIAALVSSYVAIAWLLRYLQNHNTWIFVWYRLGFGMAILAGLGLGYFRNI